MTARTTAATEHLDVVVIGAGLSGIGAAYHLRTECPGRTFAVLEARDRMGGTWDLFRYPGVRSDSDMFTLGFPFEPWDGKAIADGPSILEYVQRTAAKHDLERHVRYRTRVVSADWSSADARWTVGLEVTDDDGEVRPASVTCTFLYSCAGYYDYENPHDPLIPGLEDFGGTVVHPQFWPEDLDVDGRRVVVIGSGATAVTLVPALARLGARVTMLQRTPTWITAVPARDKLADKVRSLLPASLAHRAIRTKNIVFVQAFYEFCRRRPALARRLLLGQTAKLLHGDEDLVREHFTPSYDPWDQRLCIVPDADFFKALRRGDAEVVTDTIDRVVPEGIRLSSGRLLEADVVVTATGLRVRLFGGLTPNVDGEPVPVPEQFVWRGALLTGVPNFAVCIGYTNASWTLRADLTSRLVCKVLQHLDRRGYDAVVPRADADLEPRPLLDLSSGYVQRALADLPRQGDRGVWRVRQNYLWDAAVTLRTDLDAHLEPVRATGSPELVTAAPREGSGPS